MAETATTPSSPWVEEKRKRRRQEILKAALRAFREKGYHATTLDDIAEGLGVQKTALYHYFPDKEAILFSCHRDSVNEVCRLLEDAEQRFTSPVEKLRYLVRQHVRIMTDTLDGSPLAFEVPSLSDAHHAEIVAARDRYEVGMRGIIEAGICQGVFRKVDPKLAAFALLGAVNWIARWYTPGGSLDGEQVGKEFADFLVGGLECNRTA
ncbi:MAG: TetR/AcrR family transcriptional regulator [Gemmatimonadota bacterium]|nr:TetR/AcrR family transcriptional regulator [Gemmatimonadota bacterium]MDH5805460.1 TetR/AcrR family transcriptional regulator [Gemmatimonadota bacterium]